MQVHAMEGRALLKLQESLQVNKLTWIVVRPASPNLKCNLSRESPHIPRLHSYTAY